MSTASSQTYDTIPPMSVARELLIDPAGYAFQTTGNRVWTAALPSGGEFKNEQPGVVLVDNGGRIHGALDLLYISGVIRVRIWSGDTKLSSLWRVWNRVRKQLIGQENIVLQNDKEDWTARWCWAKDIEPAQEIRQHPETGWPELNALVQYELHGIQGEL